MKIYQNPPQSEWSEICARPALNASRLETTMAKIFQRVQLSRDEALLDYTKTFDGVSLNQVAVSTKEIEAWAQQTSPSLKQAIDQAYANIQTFHATQQPLKPIVVTTQPGVRCWREPRAIEKVGLYIPGGGAPLVSTVLMLGVPAQLAGCREIILCTPPKPDGSVSPAICYAAQLVSATRIIRVGGAQAIAALTLGTQFVPKVDKLFGPGNQYVTAAKTYAGRFGVAMDIPAGPSEVMVVTDASARADFVAADLLSQAEHGADSQAVLVTTRADFAQGINRELNDQLQALPRRQIAARALKNSFCVVLKSQKQMIDFANTYAPEHLILNLAEPGRVARMVHNAGSVFLGGYTPESAGDYASGTNHTLPTNGWARSYGGVSLESFYKFITFQAITRQGIRSLAPVIAELAEAEGLRAHAQAVRIREGS